MKKENKVQKGSVKKAVEILKKMEDLMKEYGENFESLSLTDKAKAGAIILSVYCPAIVREDKGVLDGVAVVGNSTLLNGLTKNIEQEVHKIFSSPFPFDFKK